MKKSIPQFQYNFFSFIKMLSMQYKKSRVENNRKRMSIASYIKIYTYAICHEIDSKQKWFNKLNTAVCSWGWHKLLCSISRFRILFLILCHRLCKGKVAITYLVIRTRNNLNIREGNSAAVKASTNFKKQHQTLWSLRKNKNNNFIILIRSISR